jgi:hypothetical protein
LLSEIRKQHPAEFKITNDGMTQMLGSAWARTALERGDDPRAIWTLWEDELRKWTRIRDKYSLYR